MRVAISGASGLVGRALSRYLSAQGANVIPIVRVKTANASAIYWNPVAGEIEAEKFEGLDAVVNLAGENIASKFWNEAQKQKIRDSRIKSTNLLVDTIKKLRNGPRILFSASATGFYGDRGDQLLTESSAAGQGFLAEVCQEWEAAADRLNGSGIRVINGRIGMVLSTEGGALQKMLLPFQLGAGGNLGSGNQYMSWIELTDLVRAIHFVLSTEVSGPVNLVAPAPVTNAQFTKAMGRAVSRPTILPAPAMALRLMLGEMADQLLLCSQRVVPEVLERKQFDFQYADLDRALAAALGKGAPPSVGSSKLVAHNK